MNGLLLASSPESKDIKFNSKKILDTQDELLESESKFFQNLMEELLHEIPDGKNKDFLIAKILDLPEDFAKKEEIRSSFSDEKLFTDHQIDKVSVESLIEIASFLKSHPQEQPIINFPTDSKALQTSLLDLNVQQEFKNAKTISDLLKIAEKNGIEVKNFTFFKEEAALDTHAKEMVKKINSEEIFKLLEKETNKKVQPQIVDSSKISTKKVEPLEPQKNLLKDILTITKAETNLSQRTNKLLANETNSESFISLQTENNKVQAHADQIKTEQKLQIKAPDKSAEEIQTQHNQTKVLHADKNIQSNTTITSVKYQYTEEETSRKLLQTDKLTRQTKKQTVKTEQHISKKVGEPGIQTQLDQTKSIQLHKTVQDTASTPINSLKASQLGQINKTSFQTKYKQTDNSISNISEKSQEIKKIKPLQIPDQQTDISSKLEEAHEETITVSHETKSHQTTSIKNEHNDIKKTFNTFAQEFKEKVESYKPPLMKIKMQLSPEKLGDVDVTLINRGNNLHVNINSSPTTIAFFAQNQAEFKNSLVNMGFTGLQMNFGENKDNQREQQHKNNNKQNRTDTDEILETDGFEMTVPRYI
jgi:hypothetical protein